jgi:hypothetical protein
MAFLNLGFVVDVANAFLNVICGRSSEGHLNFRTNEPISYFPFKNSSCRTVFFQQKEGDHHTLYSNRIPHAPTPLDGLNVSNRLLELFSHGSPELSRHFRCATVKDCPQPITNP